MTGHIPGLPGGSSVMWTLLLRKSRHHLASTPPEYVQYEDGGQGGHLGWCICLQLKTSSCLITFTYGVRTESSWSRQGHVVSTT
jgi:hypothetical protein